jgi:hypothetical protein
MQLPKWRDGAAMMTPEHAGWREFRSIVDRALGPLVEHGRIKSWRYSGTFANARGACRIVGLGDEIDASERWWREHSAVLRRRNPAQRRRRVAIESAHGFPGHGQARTLQPPGLEAARSEQPLGAVSG